LVKIAFSSPHGSIFENLMAFLNDEINYIFPLGKNSFWACVIFTYKIYIVGLHKSKIIPHFYRTDLKPKMGK